MINIFKNIPRKVVHKLKSKYPITDLVAFIRTNVFCPSCHKQIIKRDYDAVRCPHCGQKLKWVNKGYTQ